MSKKTIRVSLALNEAQGVATIKLGNRSNPIVVSCLGVERSHDGEITKVYINAKIHRDSKSVNYEGWEMSGAVSTVLNKIVA